MKDHYDIGVVGFWFGANYGSLLNGYAIYKTLKNFGKSVLMVHKPGEPYGDPELINGHNVDFVNTYYDPEDISPNFSYDKLSDLNKYCDCFCAGSDQIWNYPISFDENMYIPFADDSKKLISFASSFGNKTGNIPGHAKERVKNYLRRFDAISVREKFAETLLKENYGIDSTTIVEPVFLLNREEYEQMAAKSSFNASTPYMLTYILDPTEEKQRAIQYYAEKLNLRVVNILDGKHFLAGNDDYNKKMHYFAETLENTHCEDFLKAFMNASFVFTDSFHGTAFSIIFNRNFISIGNYDRGLERFSDILGRLGLLDRLISTPKDIPLDEKYLSPIDYDNTNNLIIEERKASLKWINLAVQPLKARASISHNLDISKKCVGCSSCVNICPVNAISLKTDEFGYFKAVVDKTKCTGCGLCSRACPAINLPENNNDNPSCYTFVHKDKDTIINSTSGGAFPALAKSVLKKDGVVYGAAMTDDLSVNHIRIDNINDLPKLQKSKYMQSFLGDCFKFAKNDLENKKLVLFSGCACQIAGLKKFLGKEYPNLYLIDLFCTCCPSQKIMKKYINENFGNEEKVTSFVFRHKNETDEEWSGSYIKYKTNKIEKVVKLPDNSFYSKLFILAPSHCETCAYQSTKRIADISLGDAWGIKEYDNNVERKYGVSAITINNKKGLSLLKNIPSSEIKSLKEESFNNIQKFNTFSFAGNRNWPHENYRKTFYDRILFSSFNEAFNKALQKFNKKFNKITFNSFGSCVSRDVFRYSNKYDVDVDIQRNLFENLVAPPITLHDLDKLNLENYLQHYEKFMVINNFTKGFTQDLLNSKANYLLIDLSVERWNILRVYDKHNYSHNIFYPNNYGNDKYKDAFNKIIENENFNYQVINLKQTNLQKIRRRFEDAVKLLLTKYQPSHIVILELKLAHQYLLNNKTLRTYDHEYWKINESNEFLEKLYSILTELLPNSPVIKMPTDTIGQENHLWGPAPLHYTDSYYEYVCNCLDTITGQSYIHTLNQLYNEQCLKNKIFYNNLLYENRISNLEEKINNLENLLNIKTEE